MTPEVMHQKGLSTPPSPKLYQRRRTSLQYGYQYGRRPSLPRHAMSPIDTDVSAPPPLLRSSSSSTQFSPLTPGSATTIASALGLPIDSKDEEDADEDDVSNRRSILLSPTTMSFWKRHPYHAGNLRVLLVDDNEVNLQVLTKVLKIHMADVFQHLDTVVSGESAIEKLQQDTYDMILMDIDMPGLNGVEATHWIRRGHQQQQQQQDDDGEPDLDTVLAQNRRIPIVAVTTNMSLEWKKAYLKVGMNGCIPKPISPYILRHSLTQVLMYGSHWDYSNV